MRTTRTSHETGFRISEIDVRNYRNCRRTLFRPNEGMSGLIGLNGSGKTTILNAISLLKSIFLRGGYSHDVGDAGAEKASVQAIFSGRGKTVKYKAKVAFATNERNVDEIIGVEEQWNFDDFLSERKKRGWLMIPSLVFSNGLRHQRNFLVHSAANSERMWVNYRRPNRDYLLNFSDSGLMKAVSEIGNEIAQLILRTNYYSASQFTNPLRAPSSFELEEDRPLRRGASEMTHVSFLHDLYRASKRDDATYRQFISVISGKGLGLVKGIKFRAYKFPTTQYEVKTGGDLVRKKSNREIIIPFFSLGDLKLSPNQLSEGTLKAIALVFYLITDESRLLLVEEPEVCVHHGLLVSIVELMKDISLEKQIIFSTHSDLVLDLLDPPDVFLVQYSRKSGIKTANLPSTLSAAAKSALKSYLGNTGTLGEYIKQGGLTGDE